MFKVSMKKKELEEERKTKELDSLHKTKEQLLQERHDTQLKLADLMISQTNNQGSSRQSSGPKALPVGNLDPRVAAGLAGVMVIGELAGAGLDIYSSVSRNANNESNKQLLEEKLQKVNRELVQVEKLIDSCSDGQACLTSSSTNLAIEDKPE